MHRRTPTPRSIAEETCDDRQRAGLEIQGVDGSVLIQKPFVPAHWLPRSRGYWESLTSIMQMQMLIVDRFRCAVLGFGTSPPN